MSYNNIIPTEKRIERLIFENPWWSTGNVQSTYSTMSRRLYFDLFYPYVHETDIKRALVLMGPRRVGKTVMIYHSIQQLIADGISPQKIMFIGIDNPIYMHQGLEDLLLMAKDAVKLDSVENCYVFFDEIQYLS